MGRTIRASPERGPDAGVLRWLDHEQRSNDYDFHDAHRGLIDVRSRSVRAAWRPETGGIWTPEVVWLPVENARSYGPIRTEFETAFGTRCPEGRLPLVLHPQPPASHRRLAEAHGRAPLPGVRVSPTSSTRALLGWCGTRRPAVLKLSLGARVGGVRRVVRERDVVGALTVSRLLAGVPEPDRVRLGLDWFSETAGVVDAGSGAGWLVRRLPTALLSGGDYVPAFSLVAGREGGAPLLVDIIRRAALRPEDVVVERLLRPYVSALSYLLFEEGLHVEGHAQNVLFEVDGGGELSGRLVIRDLSDVTVSVALRVARRRPLPRPGRGWSVAPFSLVHAAADHAQPRARAPIQRARDTVEHYGRDAFLGCLGEALERHFPGYDKGAVEDAYFRLWQRAAVRSLGVLPMRRPHPVGLATDEALALYLRHADWSSHGARGGRVLPPDALPLLVERRVARRPVGRFDRVCCGWGDLYLDRGLPAFFRSAF